MTAIMSIVCLAASSLLFLVGVPMLMFNMVRFAFTVNRFGADNGSGNSGLISLLRALVNPSLLSEPAATAHSALVYWMKRLLLALLLAIPAIVWYPAH